jgi:hypothetical protein
MGSHANSRGSLAVLLAIAAVVTGLNGMLLAYILK